LSGGNISPAGKPEVFIPEKVTGSLIANSIILTALKGEASLIEQKFTTFIEKGLKWLLNNYKELP
jgi:hypothetical protein